MVVGGSGYDLRLKGSWDLVTWVATETILIATYGSGGSWVQDSEAQTLNPKP